MTTNDTNFSAASGAQNTDTSKLNGVNDLLHKFNDLSQELEQRQQEQQTVVPELGDEVQVAPVSVEGVATPETKSETEQEKDFDLDIITPRDGFNFVEMFERGFDATINGHGVRAIGRDDLIAMKKTLSMSTIKLLISTLRT